MTSRRLKKIVYYKWTIILVQNLKYLAPFIENINKAMSNRRLKEIVYKKWTILVQNVKYSVFCIINNLLLVF